MAPGASPTLALPQSKSSRTPVSSRENELRRKTSRCKSQEVTGHPLPSAALWLLTTNKKAGRFSEPSSDLESGKNIRCGFNNYSFGIDRKSETSDLVRRRLLFGILNCLFLSSLLPSPFSTFSPPNPQLMLVCSYLGRGIEISCMYVCTT
jgi:hypothetical protein